MTAPAHLDTTRQRATTPSPRERLQAGLPVSERRLRLAGIPTAVLEGGSGPPMVLLHGPGELGAKFLRVLPDLVRTHRVVAPDLPAHGASEVPDGPFDTDRAVAWLDDLIHETCSAPPTLVGHVLGGALAARYAAVRSDRLDRLVLVDALGLARFRPAPRFALSLIGFQLRPTPRTYDRMMRQCSWDLDGLQAELADAWDPLQEYALELARGPKAKHVGRMLWSVGLPRIPAEQLARIAVPTALIWGRQDRANRLSIAEKASARFGWPLYVIEDCADDPPRDRPDAFLRALRAFLDES